MEHEGSGIHLPERWAVLEQALQQLKDEKDPDEDAGDEDASEQRHGDTNVQRNRDAEDTRSRNQPVRPAAGNSRGGAR